MRKFPFINLQQSIILLRIFIAVIFLLHAIVRITGGTINRFADFLNSNGWVMGKSIVWSITIFELLGGVLLALGYLSKWIALLFILLLVVGIVLIHFDNGWFVGEHGTGGMEYSVLLIVTLLVVAATDNKDIFIKAR